MFRKKIILIFTLTFPLYLLSAQEVNFTQNQNVTGEMDSAETKEPDKDITNDEILEGYIIKKVNFVSKGKTRPAAIKRNIPNIDTEKLFNSKEELEKYLNDFKQEILNLRAFESVEYTYSESQNEKLIFVTVTYTVTDSLSLLALPKPSYSSNSGAEIKVKLKDENFLGSLNPLDMDINASFGDETDPQDFSKINLGFNFSYDYPFSIGITENTYSNTFEFSWETATKEFLIDYQTGITLGIPFGDNKLNLKFLQSIIKDPDYKTFDDELYFIELASISLPLVLGYLDNTTAIKYTPEIALTQNWDKNGINDLNTDLCDTPYLSLSQNMSANHINWKSANNFRTGYSFSISQSLGWNYNTSEIEKKVKTYVSADFKYFNSTNYIGLCLNANFFAGLNTNKKIGSLIRGALDNQTFSSEYNVDSNNYALETPCALVLNLDMPVHLVTTHWLDWGYSLFGAYENQNKFVKTIGWLPHKLAKYVDFELQISPFIDVAFLKNRTNGVIFDYKESIYCAGFELLVYPQKWKSYVVRGSVGFDVGNLYFSKWFNIENGWRNPSKNYEISFGLGRHF